MSVDFQVTNKFQEVGEYTNTKSTNNGNWLYFLSAAMV